jgi:hypothetical protein
MRTGVALVGAVDTAGTAGAREEVTADGTWVAAATGATWEAVTAGGTSVAAAMGATWETVDVVPAVRDLVWAAEAEDLGAAAQRSEAEGADPGAVVVDRPLVAAGVGAEERAPPVAELVVGDLAAVGVAVPVEVAELAAGEEAVPAVVVEAGLVAAAVAAASSKMKPVLAQALRLLGPALLPRRAWEGTSGK